MGARWLDDPSDPSCKNSTPQHTVDGPRLSCKQQVGGSSPPRQLPNRWSIPLGPKVPALSGPGTNSQNGEKSWKTAWFGSQRWTAVWWTSAVTHTTLATPRRLMACIGAGGWVGILGART